MSQAKSNLITHLDDLNMPILPLRDYVLFPNTISPIEVGRQSSINALDAVNPVDRLIILAIQKNPDSNAVKASSLYSHATLARIRNRSQLSGGNYRIHAEGLFRVKLFDIKRSRNFLMSKVKVIANTGARSKAFPDKVNHLIQTLKKITNESNRLPKDAFNNVSSKTPEKSIDVISANIPTSLGFKYRLLKEASLLKRIDQLVKYLTDLSESTKIDKALNAQVKKKMDKSQREYFLNEKMKAIRTELGHENNIGEIDNLALRIEQANLPEHALDKAQAELKKLKAIPSQSPEHSVVLNYLDCLLKLPWNKSSSICKDLVEAEKILDAEHYGLEEVKSNILEHLAVQTRQQKPFATILCLVGPPGVGKTSLAASIAKATGREYVRMALGGVRDEAEIRGHRRTYIGAMCGKILQKLSQVKSNNPLFLLDEIDKMSSDFRGDPASALLEVLDPEQNKHFNDHYLDLDFDLSKVMFLATANSFSIPAALLDRMEIIELSGYTDNEKLHIAKDYLLPKQRQHNSIQAKELSLQKDSLNYIINHYTREAGVRSLERSIAKICRKVVRRALTEPKRIPVKLNTKSIQELLGPPPFKYQKTRQSSLIGQVMGLAWNQVGGDTLSVECLKFPGKGRLISTGKLGDVMQESIQAALSLVRSMHLDLAIDSDIFQQTDVHVHVPEGATPKDGPSAGVAIAVALASCYSDNPVLPDIAMTGEITLHGDVLGIGGLKQKLLAAKRSGIKTVLIPAQNKASLQEIPKDISAVQTLNIIAINVFELKRH